MCKENCICNLENESVPMQVTDAMGREIWWQDAGRPE
jgi:hypothetical protein